MLLAAVLAMGTVPFSGSAASAEAFTNNALYMDRPYVEIDTSRRMYVVDGWYSDFKVKQNLVDYDSGLHEATAEWYPSDLKFIRLPFAVKRRCKQNGTDQLYAIFLW